MASSTNLSSSLTQIMIPDGYLPNLSGQIDLYQTVEDLKRQFKANPALKESVEKLIELGCEQLGPNAVVPNGPHKGKTPLLLAARCSVWGKVKQAVKNGQILVNAAAEEGLDKGKTIAWYSAAYGAKILNWKTLNLILSHCPDVNINATATAGNSEGQSLFWRVMNGEPPVGTRIVSQTEAIDKLLDHPDAATLNMNITPKDYFNHDNIWALARAFDSNCTANKVFLRLIRQFGNQFDFEYCLSEKGIELLWKLAYDGDWEVIEAIVDLDTESKLNFNSIPEDCKNDEDDICGTLFWHIAGSKNSALIMKILRKYRDIDVNAHAIWNPEQVQNEDEEAMTALYKLVKGGHSEALQYIANHYQNAQFDSSPRQVAASLGVSELENYSEETVLKICNKAKISLPFENLQE